MKVIQRYQGSFYEGNKIAIKMPFDAQILHIETSDRFVLIWVKIDLKNKRKDKIRTFEIILDNEPFDDKNKKYITTNEGKTYHLFEVMYE